MKHAEAARDILDDLHTERLDYESEYLPLIEAVNSLAEYEEMEERIKNRIKEIKGSTNYPHNFMGQMVEDLEWVLSLLN